MAHTVEIYAERDGFISQEKAMGVGIVAMKLGAGRATKTDTIDFEAGINLAKKVGESVQKGDLIATLYSNRAISSDLIAEFKDNIEISDQQIHAPEILEVIR